MVVAIIPARGESKGIPRKNVQPLGGKPLLAWTVEAALATRSVSRVVVSTDDREIGTVAKQYGAEVVWRPAEISGDAATSESALLHALDYLRDTESYEPDLVVFLQATSPLRQLDDIQNAIEVLQRALPLSATGRATVDEPRLEMRVNDAGYWLLSTSEYLVHHMGNKLLTAETGLDRFEFFSPERQLSGVVADSNMPTSYPSEESRDKMHLEEFACEAIAQTYEHTDL